MSKKAQLPIKWDRLAKQALDGIYEYIAENEFHEVAKRVKEELINRSRRLSNTC